MASFLTLEHFVWALGTLRICLGLAPFVAARPMARMLGFPEAQITPGAIVMSRLFGVRDVGLGVLAYWAASRPSVLAFVAILQACMDGGDVVTFLIPLVSRQGIDRAAGKSAAIASTGIAAWAVVLIWLRAAGV